MLLQTLNDEIVSVGSRVHIRDIESGERELYTLTRPSDADIRQYRISTLSPIGRALYGKRAGHVVDVHAPGGVFLVEIEAVEQEANSQHARAG
jgi:transcription elongation GreA/GreB family factor